MVTQTFTRRPEGWTVALIALLLFAAAFVASAPPAAAAEDDDVRFDGSGWGHGVGMSQFGAYGMSVEGSSYTAILSHYYPTSGTGTLGQGTLSAPGPLWVNLELDFDVLGLRVDAISGAGAPVTATRGGESWEIPVGSTVEIRGPKNCSLYVDPLGDGNAFETPAGDCSFDLSWYNHLSDADPLTKIAIPGCSNTDWNVIPSKARECQYGRGMLHVRSGEGGLDLSVELSMDDYILGIAEMPYYWGDTSGMAALKAQAVAARSYARELQIYRSDLATNNCAAWCHVRDTTYDQRYVGWGHGQTNWITAANATAGVVVTHPDAPNNGIVRTYYSSSSGGRTENIQEVWSWWDDRAYYQGVDDHWAVDGTVTNPSAAWTLDVANTTVAAAVGLGRVTSVKVTERHSSGSAKTVVFSDGATSVSKPASWVKSTFGLKSIYFDTELIAGNTAAPGFTDIGNSVHIESIIEIWERGVTKGCNPPQNDRYCPSRSVTRGQMAAFLNRAFKFPATTTDFFSDDNTSIFEDDINRMAAAGVTSGCGNGNYCPSKAVTREQMAAFLDRAFGYTEGGNTDYFIDDNDSAFEKSINRVAASGVTLGCNPPANDRFCPDALVERGQMASFIDRALSKAGL